MFVLTQQNSIARQYITELRDVETQKQRARFRKNLERLGEILGYELSKSLNYTNKVVNTPLQQTEGHELADEIVIGTILRAGLPLYQGLMNIFEMADSAFIGAYRKEGAEEISIAADYVAAPSLKGKILILADPMLATGKSLVEAVNLLQRSGKAKHIHIVAAVASKPGVAYLEKKLSNISLWLGTLDGKLNQNAYIVPGLGDAGDLSFGEKL